MVVFRNRIAAMAFILAIVTVCSHVSLADVLHVPGEYSTIGDAVWQSQSGDTVLIECGVYPEHGISLRSGTTVLGASGNSNCVVVDGGHSDSSIFRCVDLAEPLSIAGLTLKHGGGPTNATLSGGGVYCSGSTLIVDNCVFEANMALNGGGAIYLAESQCTATGIWFIENKSHWEGNDCDSGGAILVSNSTLDLEQCNFQENSANDYCRGSAIAAQNSNVTIETCEFLDNITDGGSGTLSLDFGSIVSITGSWFEGNRTGAGGALSADAGSSCVITSTTFVNNQDSGYDGFGDEVSIGGESTQATLIGCTIISDDPNIDGAVFGNSVGSQFALQECVVILGENDRIDACWNPIQISCSNVFSHVAHPWIDCYADQLGVNGNFSEDPQFCGVSGSGNYYLQSDSPCAPANNGCSAQIGAFPVGCEAVSTEDTSISTIKSLF